MMQSCIQSHLLYQNTCAWISVRLPEFLVTFPRRYLQIVKLAINLLVIGVLGFSQTIIRIHLTDVKRLAFINFNSIRSSAISSPKFI